MSGPASPVTVPDGSWLNRRWFFLLLLIFLSLFYFAFGTFRNWPYKIESDGKYYYQFLVSGIVDRDFDFADNYRVKKYPWMKLEIDHYALRTLVHPVTGRPANVCTIGPAVLWTPFFLAATILGNIANFAGFHVDLNPWGIFFQYAVMYSAVVYTVMTLYFLHRLLALFFSDRVALHAPLVILVATNLLYYAVFEVSMSHVYDLFTYTAYLFVFVNCARSQRLVPYIGLAMLGALHVLVRTQNVVTILIFSAALVLMSPGRRNAGASFKVLGAYAVTLLVGMLPVLLINNYLFGNPFAIPQGNQFLDLAHPQVLGLLFSQRNGLFSHHPVLAFGGIGFVTFLISRVLKTTLTPDHPGASSTWGLSGNSACCQSLSRKEWLLFFGAMAVAFALQVYINSTARDWWSGHSFGQRRLISSLPLFVFGLAYLADRLRALSRRWYASAAGVLSLSGIYLMFIHVFLWDYDKPHNILAWMFWYAPKEALKVFR